jgi:DUF1016 N-terminal domain
MTTLDKNPQEFNHLLHTLTDTHKALQQQAVRSVDIALVVRNWLFGWHIVEFEQGNAARAQLYGKQLIDRLAKSLALKGIQGASATSLRQCRSFYLAYEKIQQTLSVESLPAERIAALRERFTLGWSHYVQLLTVSDEAERRFYEIEAQVNSWGVRELKRQIDSSLFERLALSRDKAQVTALAQQGQIVARAQDIIKNPYVLEFLDLPKKPGIFRT